MPKFLSRLTALAIALAAIALATACERKSARQIFPEKFKDKQPPAAHQPQSQQIPAETQAPAQLPPFFPNSKHGGNPQ